MQVLVSVTHSSSGSSFSSWLQASFATAYFTAGSNGEADGLFGSLGAVRASDHDSDDKAAANLKVGMSTTAE